MLVSSVVESNWIKKNITFILYILNLIHHGVVIEKDRKMKSWVELHTNTDGVWSK